MADIFLSYASEDRQRVRPLVNRFEEHGWDVWWDREIPPGQTWTDVLERALSETRAMVVVWTKASIRSDWVEIEASEGRKRGGLFPVKLDEVVPPLQFRLTQAADLTDWDGSFEHAQFQALVRQLEVALKKDADHGNASVAELPTSAKPIRPIRRLEALAPSLPPVRDYGSAAGSATWNAEPYTVAVARGILDDGSYCVVAVHPSNRKREYLIEPQIPTETEARRLAEIYRERCSVPGLVRGGDIPILDRKYEVPLLLRGRSEKQLEDDLRSHVKESLAYISGFKLKMLYETPFVLSLGACAVYLFDWSVRLPDWVPFAQQVVGSGSIGPLQLASVFPGFIGAKMLLDRIRSRSLLTNNAIASEIVTTLACNKGWSAERFRELLGGEIFSSKVRGFMRWIFSPICSNEVKSFEETSGKRSELSPFDYQRETFERYIHALVFQRHDGDYSDQAMIIDTLFVAGDFQAPQLEYRLSFLGPREERELRYRVRTAAERAFLKRRRFAMYLISAPMIIAIVWSVWLSWLIGPAVFSFNLLVGAGLVLHLVRSFRITSPVPSVPPELFIQQWLLKDELIYYAKLTREVPRGPGATAEPVGGVKVPAGSEPVVSSEPVRSGDTASSSEKPGRNDV